MRLRGHIKSRMEIFRKRSMANGWEHISSPRVTRAIVIVLLMVTSDEVKTQTTDVNPFTICQTLQGGIQSKQAMLEAWKIMLMVHLGKTADNVVAYPAMEAEQLKTFETGLRRAIIVDAKIRAIIDKVYSEQSK